MSAKVAFIGLGVMGFPMAGHLKSKGFDVVVYNRTAAKAAEWVKKHGNNIHHIAYAVDDLAAAVEDAKSKGVEFLSEKQIENDDLIQIFTRPHDDTGVIHELIQRKHPGAKGFATENVKKLMDSTRNV